MAKTTEDIAQLEFNTRGIDFLAPCCEICGCTMSKSVQKWWVEWEGAPEGDWPRFHPDCLDAQIGKEKCDGVPYTDVFAFS
jgi:hypothetical protein